jgi:hypothetical protein
MNPAVTHWPAIIYEDEKRNLALRIPIPSPGLSGSLGWVGSPAQPFTLPREISAMGLPMTEATGAVVDLPANPGLHSLVVTMPGISWQQDILIRPADSAWGITALRNGFPVDSKDRPTILTIVRRDYNLERRHGLFKPSLKRPSGPAVFIGDPLTAMGKSPLDGLELKRTDAGNQRYPLSAALIGLDTLLASGPTNLIWSPGNGDVDERTWSPELPRLMELVAHMAERSGFMPRCILLLPPEPVDPAIRPLALERNKVLTTAAEFHGWTIIDTPKICGSADTANLLSPGFYAPSIVGPARETLQAAIKAALAE